MTREVVVIKGDIVKSTQIEDRKTYWNNFKLTLKNLNSKFKNSLPYPLEIVKGDEITGVCKNLNKGYEIAVYLVERILPNKIRIVLSKGGLDTSRKVENLNELDGEAFWNAAIFMDKIKSQKVYFSIHTGREVLDKLLSNHANLITILKHEWTDTERKIILLYDKEKKQKKVAKILNISQQSVSDGLRRAKYKQIRKAEEALLAFL